MRRLKLKKTVTTKYIKLKNLPFAIDKKYMSLKYQNSELFETYFRINSTGDHTYQKNTYYYVH